MTKAEVNERVAKILADHIGNTAPNRTDQFDNDLNMDSLDKIDFTMSVEKEFNISIPDDRIDEFANYGDLLDYLYTVLRAD